MHHNFHYLLHRCIKFPIVGLTAIPYTDALLVNGFVCVTLVYVAIFSIDINASKPILMTIGAITNTAIVITLVLLSLISLLIYYYIYILQYTKKQVVF